MFIIQSAFSPCYMNSSRDDFLSNAETIRRSSNTPQVFQYVQKNQIEQRLVCPLFDNNGDGMDETTVVVIWKDYEEIEAWFDSPISYIFTKVCTSS